MLTYHNNIFKEILEPIGIQFYFKEGKCVKCKTQVQSWEMMIADRIRFEMNVKSFTAISNGEKDPHEKHGTDNKRKKLKDLLHHDTEYYKSMSKNIDNMIRTNAEVMVYQHRKGKNAIIYENDVSRTCELIPDIVKKTKIEIIEQLGKRLEGKLNIITCDKQLTKELKEFIKRNCLSNPKVVLEILLIRSVFEKNESDKTFYRDFSNHYCKKTEQISEIREVTDTIVIEANEETVLYREKEVKEIIEILQTGEKNSILLAGFAGAGKTTVARCLYSKMRSSYDYLGWINYTDNLKDSMIAAFKNEEYSDDTMTEKDVEMKWKHILKKYASSNKRNLFVIDNVNIIPGKQDPRTDRELLNLPRWKNTTIIIITRLPSIPGFGQPYTIGNLGSEGDDKRCVELFYHYNKEAREFEDDNRDIVKELCRLVDYNTMVIELLAKGSVYDYHDLSGFYNKIKEVGFKYVNEVPVQTIHDYDDREIEGGFYTSAGQLMKLFNLRIRTEKERAALWDFHCLPESEKISRTEMKEWMGCTIADIDELKNEGWIKYTEGMFSIHPLVRQSIICAEEEWEKYSQWNIDDDLNIRKDSLYLRIRNNTLYKEDDSFEVAIKKIKYTDYLCGGGKNLSAEALLYIAANARKRGVRDIGVKYYEKAYLMLKDELTRSGVLTEGFLKLTDESMSDEIPDIALEKSRKKRKVKVNAKNIDRVKLLWRSTYYYGYMLSYTSSGYEKALCLLFQAYYIILGLGEKADVRKYLAQTLDHIGYTISYFKPDDTGWILCAEHFLYLAINIRKALVKESREDIENLHDLAWSQDNLGNLYAMTDIDKIDGNCSFIIDFSPLIRNILKIDNETKELSGDSMIRILEKDNPTVDPGHILKESLTVRIKLSAMTNGRYDSEVGWTYCNLARYLSQDESQRDEAEKMIKAALAVYEKMEEEFPEQHRSSIARTYRTYAKLLSDWDGRRSEAVELLNKALNLNRRLEDDYPGLYRREIEIIENELNALL